MLYLGVCSVPFSGAKIVFIQSLLWVDTVEKLQIFLDGKFIFDFTDFKF